MSLDKETIKDMSDYELQADIAKANKREAFIQGIIVGLILGFVLTVFVFWITK